MLYYSVALGTWCLVLRPSPLVPRPSSVARRLSGGVAERGGWRAESGGRRGGERRTEGSSPKPDVDLWMLVGVASPGSCHSPGLRGRQESPESGH